jgi:16S rRNA C967 or C1407 C5-methylase (RsmB/RsmF family)/NOL1/NOP2/fmu family ribosome biogenesis protein
MKGQSMTAGQFPQAFIKREQANLGDQWNDFKEAHHLVPPVSIRLNPQKTFQANEGSRIPWTTHGRYLDERPSFTLDPTFHGGKYYVQEASSMFLEQAFRQHTSPNESLMVLDLCSAPGGKSTHLLSMMSEQSLLVSNEVIQSRASIVAENIKKWGYCNVVVTNNDPKDFQRLQGFFDVIVVDAPCSGEGLFRKDPSALQEWSEEVVALCSRRQRRILSDVWPALKAGGVLIYSTCTYNADENEENLKWLKGEYAVESLSIDLNPHWGIQKVEAESLIGYRCFPHRVKGEGFFLSAIRKLHGPSQKNLSTKAKFHIPSKKISTALSEWLHKPHDKSFLLHSDRVQFFPGERIPEVQAIIDTLRVIFAGTSMATIKHDKLIPDHALALSTHLNPEFFNSISLDKNFALQYLRKESLQISTEKRGFALVTFENIGLGWVNVLDNRLNNLYPPEWRVRIR